MNRLAKILRNSYLEIVFTDDATLTFRTPLYRYEFNLETGRCEFRPGSFA